jgi:hypothetical protein
MELSSIVNRLLDVVTDGTGARVRFVGQPFSAPQNYPAAWVEWLRTEPTSNTYGSRGTDGRRSKKAVATTLTVTGLGRAGVIEAGIAMDEAQQDMADAVMDAIEADDTLRDVTTSDAVARATVNNVQPYMGEFGFGVQAEVSVIDL